MEKDSKIFVAGHKGMVGSAICRDLAIRGYDNIVCRTHQELDLKEQAAVEEFFEKERPEYVFMAAAMVGGILANSELRAEFIYNNLAVQNNVIHSSYKYGVNKLLFLGSSCVYPRACPQPIKEEYLLTGPLEPTNEPYAIAKIAGIKMCESYNRQYDTKYIAVMPTNLYGPYDNFNLRTSHVIAALVHKFVVAHRRGLECVEVWGSGKPRREFMHVDDAAAACVSLMIMDYNLYKDLGVSHINIGTGSDLTIMELAQLIKEVVGYQGAISFDSSKPDGTLRKLLDISLMNKLNLGSGIPLGEGVAELVKWFINNDSIV
jgi:GDP-L-fucose synthase